MKENFSRRSFIKTAGALGAGLALGPFISREAWGQPVFKIGLLPRTHSFLVLGYPEVERKYNIKFEYVPAFETLTAIVAVSGGSLHGANATPQHIFQIIREKLDVVAVCTMTGGWIEFDIRSNIPVKYGDFAGLKAYIQRRKREGKPFKIAAPTGSYQHLMLLWQFKRHGIDMKDVEVLSLIFPEHGKVLELGQVDMVSTVSPFGAFPTVKGKAKVFYYPYDAPSGKNSIMLVVRGKDIRERRDFVQAAVSATVDLIKRAKRDPDWVFKVYAKDTGMPEPMLKHYLKNVDFTYHMDVNDMKGAARMLYEMGWAKRDLSGEIGKAVDFSFLEKATGLSRRELSTWKSDKLKF